MAVMSSKDEAWRIKFKRYLVGQMGSNGEWRGFCPGCEDPETSKTPSASFSFEKHVFHCLKQGCKGSFKDAEQIIKDDDYAARKGNSRKETPSSASVRSIDDAPSKRNEKAAALDESLVDGWVDSLQASEVKLRIMHEARGLNNDTVLRFKIGWWRDRFTIPVYDINGALVNVRKYKSNAKANEAKMVNTTGCGQARLFLPEVLRDNDTVILVEGEMDAIIGQQHGLPTMATTSGAMFWDGEWSPLFAGKTVFICYDVDDAGVQGASKVSRAVGKYAEAVHVIRLPMTVKGSDLTDYLVGQGYTADSFRKLMEAARDVNESRVKPDIKTLKITPVSLEQSMSAEHSGKPLELIAAIAAKVQPAYVLPESVEFECTMDFGPSCQKCIMSASSGQGQKTIDAADDILLSLIDKSEEQRRAYLLKSMQIPARCTRVDVEITSEWNVDHVVGTQSMDDRGEQAMTPVEREIFIVGRHDTPVNTVQRIVGVNRSSPKNGRAIFQAWHSESVLTNIDKFELTPAIRKGLKRFQPKKGQTPLEKMREIAEDMEANVTRIYGRPELHIAYDLVWHSAIGFKFAGKRLEKGWLELLVMGDTRTGKSEVATRLCEHYESGMVTSCETMTLAGLLGGAKKAAGDSWMVQWGLIPLNDRRLMVLDEVSGMVNKGIFENMSHIRSSGIAEINKISTAKTSARTRLIWISNPVDGRTIAEMTTGAIEAVTKLVRNPEDLARFDLAMVAASKEVDGALINSIDHPEVRHQYTREVCSNLVAWVWSRKVDDISWEPGLEEHVMSVSTELGRRYATEPPLIQEANVREKVARMAVAIAGRLYSTTEDGEGIVVKKEHVAAAVELIDMLYGNDSFGYLRHSRKVIREREQAKKFRKECIQYLDNNEGVRDTLEMVGDEAFKARDFSEFGQMGRDEQAIAVKELRRMRMIRNVGRGNLRMEPALTEVLRKLDDRDDKQ